MNAFNHHATTPALDARLCTYGLPFRAQLDLAPPTSI